MADRLIRAVLAEDSLTAAELIVNYLDKQDDITVVGVAKNGIEAVKMTADKKPDIVLMDINMPKMDGFEATREIMQSTPTPIILQTASWKIEEVKKILKSMDTGALGVFEKPRGPGDPEFRSQLDEIIESIRVLSQVKVFRRWNRLNPKTQYTKPLPIKICERRYKAVVIGASGRHFLSNGRAISRAACVVSCYLRIVLVRSFCGAVFIGALRPRLGR